MGVYTAGGGGSSIFQMPCPSNCFVTSVVNAVGNRNLATVGSGNVDSMCPLFILAPQTFKNIGVSVAVAGDASSVVNIGLYVWTGGVQFNQVVPEIAVNVGASTGPVMTPINLALSAGRYLATIRSTFTTTAPNLVGSQASAGWWEYAIDILEATSDFSRGAYQGAAINGYSTGPPPSSFTLNPITRSATARVFLQAA